MDVTVGTVIAGRYAVEARAGAGGMGVVYRARDRETDRIVALKLLRAMADDPARRFAREAWLLSDLAHPGIVRYVDHGQADDGSLYLAMEWLDGEDLATRLGRGPLPLPDALDLGRRVADALAAAHERGIVHRDLKPSNLFLVGGAASAAVVLDFGLARLTTGMSTVTVQGTVMGTPGYMAPEQVRCEASLGPPADLFAVGCVLYECIAGRSPFPGDRPWARLAKILFEEPPPLAARRAEVPPALDELVRTLLAKDPRDRLADGRELHDRLAAIAIGPAPARSRATSITDDEVRLVSVVVAAAAPATGAGDPDITITGNEPVSTVSDRGARLHRLAADHGGRVEQLPQGLAIATLVGRGTATDAAAQAARCALEMRALLPGTRIVLTTGRAAYSGTWPVGTTIDRAADLLGDSGDAAVVVDPATAGLLDGRFEIVATPGGLVLGGERAAVGRTLLGRPSPFVGRDRELAALEALIAAALDEPAARAIIVTGDAGIGKSRLWAEAAARLAGRPDAELWIARGDPTSAGASFGLIAQIVRRAAGARDGAPLAERQAALEALVARRLPVTDRARVAAFLGELVGAPFAEAGRDQLAAARQDPLRMGDQVRRAWEDLVAATAADHPLVVVVEDLHWGDLPSVKLLDAALRHAGALPLVVIGLARPDVHRQFPALWAERRRDELHLGALPRRGAADLVRSALGAAATDDTVGALVERAEGNAFFLEELIRAAAEGRDGAPETVVAMVQARLDALDAALRRVLRAASIYGQVSRPAGVAAALGVPAASRALAAWLAALRDRELLTERREADAVVYAFRHALVRDAVYQSLTAADRALGHRLAADWLEAEGHGDPLALADHLEKGGEPARAIAWLERAAHQALEGNDFAAALACVDRGIACGATGEALGGLLFYEAQARIWRGELSEAEVATQGALAALPAGDPRRYRALGRLAWIFGQRRRLGDVPTIVDQIRDVAPTDEAEDARRVAMAQASLELLVGAPLQEAASAFRRLDAQVAARALPLSSPWMHLARAFHASRHQDRGAGYLELAAAVRGFEAIGDHRLACLNRANAAFWAYELGAFEDAELELRAALATAERLGLPHIVAHAKSNLSLVVAEAGDLDGAVALTSEAAAWFRDRGNQHLEATARIYLARLYRKRGELLDAEQSARLAVELVKDIPAQQPHAAAELALGLLDQGRTAEALEAATSAMQRVELGGVNEGEFIVRLAYVKALRASGNAEAADSVAMEAADRLRSEAAKISIAEYRASFLGRIAENVTLLAIAAEGRTAR